MEWYIVQCANTKCSRYMASKSSAISKGCPFCGKRFKINDGFIQNCHHQKDAIYLVKRYNLN